MLQAAIFNRLMQYFPRELTGEDRITSLGDQRDKERSARPKFSTVIGHTNRCNPDREFGKQKR